MPQINPPATKKQAANDMPRIGKAWKKTDKNGKEFISISIDKENFAKFSSLVINPGDCLMVFNNDKRPGKNDADYTVHLLIPKVAEC